MDPVRERAVSSPNLKFFWCVEKLVWKFSKVVFKKIEKIILTFFLKEKKIEKIQKNILTFFFEGKTN